MSSSGHEYTKIDYPNMPDQNGPKSNQQTITIDEYTQISNNTKNDFIKNLDYFILCNEIYVPLKTLNIYVKSNAQQQQQQPQQQQQQSIKRKIVNNKEGGGQKRKSYRKHSKQNRRKSVRPHRRR
jgi:hypothetical protein